MRYFVHPDYRSSMWRGETSIPAEVKYAGRWAEPETLPCGLYEISEEEALGLDLDATVALNMDANDYMNVAMGITARNFAKAVEASFWSNTNDPEFGRPCEDGSPDMRVLDEIQHAIDKSADVRHPQAPLFATPDKCPTETPEDRFYADRRMAALGGLPPLQRKQVEDMMRRRREREEQEDKAHKLSAVERWLANGFDHGSKREYLMLTSTCGDSTEF